MKHDYSLAHLTVLSLTPPQVVAYIEFFGFGSTTPEELRRYAKLRY